MSKYIVDEQTMKGIADAVRGMRHENGTMTPTQIKEKIKDVCPGIPLSISGHMANGHWIRPAEYPDLDALKEQIPEKADCVYLTYDLRKTPDVALISIRCSAVERAKWLLERGHLESGQFIVDESHEVASNDTYYQQLTANNGAIQLWRVSCASGIATFGFSGWPSSTMNASTYIGYQPCVECAGRLPHLTTASQAGTTYTGTIFTAGGTFWLERYAVALGGTAASMGSMFRECYSLQEIVTDDWNTSEWIVTSLSQAFYGCRSLQALILGHLDTSNWRVTSLNQIWQSCGALQVLDLYGWNTAAWTVTDMREIWAGCRSLKRLDLSSWDTGNWAVTTLYNCWHDCNSLLEIKGLNDLDTSNWPLTSIASSGGYGPFVECWSLRELDISRWDTSRFAVAQPHTWFNACYSCQEIKCPTDMGDVSTSTNASNPPNYIGLVHFNGYKIYSNHSYGTAHMLTHESLVNILTNLPIVTETRTITLGNTNKSKLTPEEIAIATQKGWTVA